MLYTTTAINKKLLPLTICLFISFSSSSQINLIKGIVVDTAEKKKLQYAIVALINLKDSTLYKSIRSTENGSFLIRSIASGKYRLMISYPQMADYLEEININDTTKKDFGKIPMLLEATLLADVVVKYVPPIRMKGDTLEYVADSFLVKPGANVQELLKRLPGIQVDRKGKITAQGKEVKKILVDGDEFFSDDPGLASKYLKASSVDKVQVFDKKSDKAEFTGIDDGQRTKTINLELKADNKNGYFGTLSTAAGDKDYHDHGAMVGLFKGAEKMSVFGMATKTGSNELSKEELVKYVSQDYENIDDGTGMTFRSDDDEPESPDVTGIPSVLYGGAHYSNNWRGGNEKLFVNYRIRNVNAAGWSNSKSTNVLPGATSFTNTSNSANNNINTVQKGSGNFAIPIDSFSSIKIFLSGNLQHNNDSDTSYTDSKNENNFFVNNSKQSIRKLGDKQSLSSDISYQRNFLKKGRTLSISLQKDDSNNKSDVFNYAANTYFNPLSGLFLNTDTLNQLQHQNTTLHTIGLQAKYTDRLNEHLSAAITYGWKQENAGNLFVTDNKNNGKYDVKIDSLSNDYTFISTTQIAEATLSWNQHKLNFSLGSKFFFTGYKQHDNSLNTLTKRNFVNYAPTANISFAFSTMKRLTISYFGHTNQPSVEQLQPLRKSSNPLYVQLGNAFLEPSLNHNISLNYNNFNWQKGTNINFYASGHYTQNDITSKTTTDANDRTISQYINLNNIPGIDIGGGYSWQYKKLHLKPNISASIESNGNYSFLNGIKSKNNNAEFNISIGTGYEIDELVELDYSTTVNFDVAKTTINNTTNTTWSHIHKLATTFTLPFKLTLESDVAFNFQPKNASFGTQFNTIQWNASLAKKIFKNDNASIKFSINNILNNNTSYIRTVDGGTTLESNQLVIRRYWLLGFTWDFSKNSN